MEKIFKSSEQLEKFQWNFQEDVAYNNIKSHKKPGLYPVSRRYSFEKTTGGQIDPSSRLRVKC